MFKSLLNVLYFIFFPFPNMFSLINSLTTLRSSYLTQTSTSLVTLLIVSGVYFGNGWVSGRRR